MFRDPDFAQAFLVRRADRLLWGTDWYDLRQRSFAHFDLFARFELPTVVVQRIAHDNAKRLFPGSA
jgi:hypothetical protein